MLTTKKLVLSLPAGLAAFLVPLAAFAQGGGDSGASNAWDPRSWAAIGAGVAIGLAVLGGGLGQGRAAAAALEGISRNPGAQPKIMTPFILGLALIESLVLFALAVAILLQLFASSPVK
jgi:F-type H+-transporting ATPase subunit c